MLEKIIDTISKSMYNYKTRRNMPTVFRYDGYRFYFYSNEHLPEHIHVENGDGYARVVLKSLEVTDSYKLKSKELKLIIKLVRKHRQEIEKAWYEYFKK
jgi:NADH:ubiquinone oxidoreductase subunit D